MGKFGFIATAALVAALSSVSTARAATMTCLLGVYDAQTLTNPDLDFGQVAEAITVPLVDGDASAEVKVKGETIAVSMLKKQFTDAYEVLFWLTTPVADRVGRSHMVAGIADFMYNEGPTENNGWNVAHSPTSERFMYVRSNSGMFGYSVKLINAMKAAGVWHTENFLTANVGLNNAGPTVDFVKEQLAAGKLKPTDIVGIATFLTCSRENKDTSAPVKAP